jgi:hypothetical protein
MTTHHACLLLVLGALTAQAPQPPAVRALSERHGFWRVPIHTNADVPGYGVWAADRDFKASFHDGFVFYPQLGRAYPENLPLRWTTVGVTAGGHPIADVARSEHARTDSRYEYRYGDGGVTEAYDVRADGVEQTFVIAARPPVQGDLVVEGRIDTKLVPVAGDVRAAHTELVFADRAGVPLVSYGKAFARDARGDTTEVTTSLEGSDVRLCVPAAWLAEATFPVTVDPLTSRVTVVGGTVNTYPEYTAIHTENVSPAYGTMIAFERVFSATNIDAFAYLATDDLSISSLVFNYTSTAYALKPDVTFVVGADRWLVSFEYRSGTLDYPIVYIHRRNDTGFKSGITRSVSGTAPYVLPSIAGSLSPTSTKALLVFEIYSATGGSTIYGASLDALSGAVGTPFLISVSGLDAQEPDVNCQADVDDDGWVVTYTARSSSADDYDIYVTRVSTSSFAVGATTLIGPDNDTGDKVHPVVQGWGGRYMVAMLQDVEARVGLYFGKNLWSQRIDWPNATALPTKLALQRTLGSNRYVFVNHHLGFDGDTRSHWCLVYDADQGPAAIVVSSYASVFGYSGGELENVPIDGGNNRYSSSVAYNARRKSFALAFCAIETVANGVYGQFMEHPTNAVNIAYGTGCGPATLTSPTAPWAGSQFYELELGTAPANQPAALWLSVAPANVQLGGYGVPSCFLNVAAIAVDIPFSTGQNGAATLTVALPDRPVFRGNLYWQAVYLWPGSPDPFPVALTAGLRSVVR